MASSQQQGENAPSGAGAQYREYLLLQAYDTTNDGWLHLGQAGAYIRKMRPDFRPQLYGHGGLRDLVASKSEAFRIDERRPESGGAPVTYVRPTAAGRTGGEIDAAG